MERESEGERGMEGAGGKVREYRWNSWKRKLESERVEEGKDR